MKRRRNLPGPFSSTESLTNLDRRTVPARIMKTVVADLLAHIGDDVTAPQKLIIQAAGLKAVRLALLSDKLLTDENGLAEGGDHHALAWLNSLRLDLMALGLERRERRERQILDLNGYLKDVVGSTPNVTDVPEATVADAA